VKSKKKRNPKIKSKPYQSWVTASTKLKGLANQLVELECCGLKDDGATLNWAIPSHVLLSVEASCLELLKAVVNAREFVEEYE